MIAADEGLFSTAPLRQHVATVLTSVVIGLDSLFAAAHDYDGFICDLIGNEISDIRDFFETARHLPDLWPEVLLLHLQEFLRQIVIFVDDSNLTDLFALHHVLLIADIVLPAAYVGGQESNRAARFKCQGSPATKSMRVRQYCGNQIIE